jgi:hypothetical protein
MAPLCELPVFSRRHRYAGTLDVLGVYQGSAALLDYKTGSPRDVGASWQTAAYHGALLDMFRDGETSQAIAFEPIRHVYTLDGDPLPSVTQVLQSAGIIDFSGIPAPILLAARDRGAAVHKACHYYNDDDLDVDLFAAEYPDYWPYLSAWIAFRRESGFVLATSLDAIRGLGLIRRYAVQLRPDGQYRVDAYRGVSDYPEFLTLLRAQEIVARHRGTTVAREEVA